MFDSPTDARRFMLRIAMFYGALFVVYGMKVPFLPVWLDWRGLSASEISLVMSAPFFIRLAVTPALALFADRRGAHRAMLIGLAWVALSAALVLSQCAGFAAILLLTVVLIVSASTVMPMIETIAVSGVRRGGLDYGRMRLWGSLTFIAASVAGGAVVTEFGRGSGVWLVAFGCLLTVVAAHLLPRPASGGDLTAKRIGQPSRRPFWQAPELSVLFAAPAFRTFLVAGGLSQAAHATLLAFGALIWQQQGLSGLWIGTLWAIAVLAEVALFAWSAAVVARFGPVNLLILAASAGIVRWVIMAFEPGLAILIPLQILHGLTFGASHIAAIYFLRAAIPDAISGTAQALYATVAAGLAMGMATLLAGWIYAEAGARSYLAMAVAAVLALAFSLYLKRLWHGQLLVVEAGQSAADENDAATPVGEAAASNRDVRDRAGRPPVPLPPEAGVGG